MSVYGKVELDPEGDVVAGSMCSWRITYTVGKYGIDDGGSIVLLRKSICEMEEPQFEDPKASGYITATTTGDAELELSYCQNSFSRPWNHALRVDVRDGSLKEGDKITLVLGDRSEGGPGIRAQTFQESEFLFKVLVDPFWCGKTYYEVPSPRIRIIGGPAETLQVFVPSTVTLQEEFSILVRAMDSWGNPSPNYNGKVSFRGVEDLARLPGSYKFSDADKGVKRFKEVRVVKEGIYRFEVEDDSGLKAPSNPLICQREGPSRRLLWGDIHGQTHGKSRRAKSDTVGTGTPGEYFQFARDVAGIDFCSWHGNDLQISNELWEDVCKQTEKFNENGRFVTFLGYEWSGNTPNGGDHNVYYLRDHQPIYRSSHALVEDKSDSETDRSPISELWKTLRGRRDVMAIPHVGGRYANLDFYDPEFIRLIEIYSFHGAFEWLAEEAIERSLKVGFIAGSDDHTCRPGIEYAMLSKNHTKGGLVAAYAESLSREDVWKALWERRCYGTTGARIILSVEADGHTMGSEFTTNKPPKIHVDVHGTDRILEALIMRGLDVIYRYPTTESSVDDRKILIMWSGARSKGRDKRTDWDGRLSLDEGRILSCRPFAFLRNGKETVTKVSNQAVSWNSFTLGDYKGVLLEVDTHEDAILKFHSIPKNFTFQLKDVTTEPFTVEAGGVDQEITVREASPEQGQVHLEIEHEDKDIKKGWNAYWLRLQQWDGEMAWSSPVYINYQPAV